MSETPSHRFPIAVFLLFTGLQLLLFAPRLNSDGAYYYEFMRSLVIQNDLNFDDEREFFTWEWVPVFREYIPGKWGDTGYPPNIFSFGPAMVWLPAYTATHAIIRALGAVDSPLAISGYGIAYRLLPMTMSMLAGLLTLCWIDRLSRRSGYSRSARTLALAAILGASNLPAFLFVTPAFSHAISTAASTAFFILWLDSRDRSSTAWRFALYGLVTGLMMASRWQNGVNLILPFADFISDLFVRSGRRLTDTIRRWSVWTASFLIAVAPQLLVTGILYGNPFVDPQGQGGMHWLSPRFDLVLFEATKGLLMVNPVFLPAILGIGVLAVKRRDRIAFGAVVLFVLHLYINAVRRDWAGVGFGMRRFLDLIPVFALGLMALMDVFHVERRRLLRGSIAGLIGCATIWNLLLMGQYYYSKMGAPWVPMTRIDMIRTQFTEAPGLLMKLAGTSLLGEMFRTAAATPAIALLLSLIASIGLWRAVRNHPAGRSPRTDRLLVLSGAVYAGILIIWIAGSAISAERVHTVNMVEGNKQGSIRTLRMNPAQVYRGWPGGIRFHGDSGWTQVDARAEYTRSEFLTLGTMRLIESEHRFWHEWGLRLTTPVHGRCIAIVYRPETPHPEPGILAHVTVGFADRTEERFDLPRPDPDESGKKQPGITCVSWRFPAIQALAVGSQRAFSAEFALSDTRAIQWINVASTAEAGQWMLHGMSIRP